MKWNKTEKEWDAMFSETHTKSVYEKTLGYQSEKEMARVHIKRKPNENSESDVGGFQSSFALVLQLWYDNPLENRNISK
jgi:hypothetical protein